MTLPLMPVIGFLCDHGGVLYYQVVKRDNRGCDINLVVVCLKGPPNGAQILLLSNFP